MIHFGFFLHTETIRKREKVCLDDMGTYVRFRRLHSGRDSFTRNRHGRLACLVQYGRLRDMYFHEIQWYRAGCSMPSYEASRLVS